ncbi:PAS domain-containing protein [Rhodobacteraceae bacterium S2214]|nr:PAS domain-containing protein [Rhodobacteraceae bacterium S2214]
MPNEREYTTQHRTPFHDQAGEDVLTRVEAHWQDMRKGSALPNRVDMTPGPLSDSLAHCFTLERVTPSVARFRVAGRAIHQILNLEPRGMPISALFTPMGREMVAPIIYDVCEGPEISEIPLVAPRGLGRSPLRGRMLLLPLKHDGEAVNRIFGAIVIDGRAGRRPLRFEFDSEQSLRSEPVQPVIRTVHEILKYPDVAPVATPPLPSPQIWEPPALQPTSTPTPALRLVVDNT